MRFASRPIPHCQDFDATRGFVHSIEYAIRAIHNLPRLSTFIFCVTRADKRKGAQNLDVLEDTAPDCVRRYLTSPGQVADDGFEIFRGRLSPNYFPLREAYLCS